MSLDPESDDFSDGSWSPGVWERDESGQLRCVRRPVAPRDEDDREETES